MTNIITQEQLINMMLDLEKYGNQLANRPDYLYHYTSIKGLAYILKSKKIKFTPLTEKDDKLECILDKIQHIRKYVFSSSWTDLERESIPFWSMYTEQMRGIRIKLPTYMFTDKIVHIDSKKISDVRSSTPVSIVPECNILGENYYIWPMSIKNEITLSKIRYSDNNEVNNFYTEEGINFKDWGIIKTKDWEFQSEWRFRIIACPINYSTSKPFENSVNEMIEGKDINLKEIFVDIDLNAFNQMEIILGPRCDNADEIIVRALVEQYNRGAKIELSKLSIR